MLPVLPDLQAYLHLISWTSFFAINSVFFFFFFFFSNKRKKDGSDFKPDTISSFRKTPSSHLGMNIFYRAFSFNRTRTLLVALSLACLKISFVVKGAGAVILLFRLEYKTSIICHTVNAQNVKIATRDRPLILASNRCETFKNLLHIDIAPVRTPSGILQGLDDEFYQYQEPMTLSV